MRHGTSNNRRSRGRNNNKGGHRNNNQRTQVFDSNGPDVRIRGTAHQVAEKYLALAKDATSAGDIVVAENYFQHAEHYIRVIGEQNGTFSSTAEAEENSENQRHDNHRSDNHRNEKPKAQKPKEEVKAKEDDLALPASILGDKPEIAKETVVEDETV